MCAYTEDLNGTEFQQKEKNSTWKCQALTHTTEGWYSPTSCCFTAMAYSFCKPDEKKKIIDAFYKANSTDYINLSIRRYAQQRASTAGWVQSESPTGGSFQAARSCLHVQFSSALSSPSCKQHSQLESSHAMALQPGPGSDAAHTRMLCAQPGLQAAAAQQSEELQGRHTVTLSSFQLLTTVSGTETIVTHPAHTATTKQR